MLLALVRWWPTVDCCLYVDDLHLAHARKKEAVRDPLVGAANYVVTHFQEVLLPQVSLTKSCAVATSVRLVRSLAVAIKGASVKPIRDAKSLGIGAGGGRR